MKIAIEYIRWLDEERAKINRVGLDDIEFFENGMRVEVTQAAIDWFVFTGLSNIHFITGNVYKCGLLDEIDDD